MSRSLWKRALFSMAGVGLSGALVAMSTQAQTPFEAPHGSATTKAERTVTLYENGKSLRCRLIHTWKLPDGSTAHQLSAVHDGETITLIEDGSSTRMDGKEARPTRIYHWGLGAATPPPGVPAFRGASATSNIAVANGTNLNLPDANTIPVTTNGPRVLDLPSQPTSNGPETTVTNNGPRMVDGSPRTLPNHIPASMPPTSVPPAMMPPKTYAGGAPLAPPPSAPITTSTPFAPSTPIIAEQSPGAYSPPTYSPPTYSPPTYSKTKPGSRLFAGPVTKTTPISECTTCVPTPTAPVSTPVCETCPPSLATPHGVGSVAAPKRGSLFGSKTTTQTTTQTLAPKTSFSPSGETIITVTDPANGSPPVPIVESVVTLPKSDPQRSPSMPWGAGLPKSEPLRGPLTQPVVALPQSEPQRGPLMQRVFGKPAPTTQVIQPAPARVPFSTAMAPALNKETKSAAMPKIETPTSLAPPPMLAETRPDVSEAPKAEVKPVVQQPKRDWRLSWGKTDAPKAQVPGQSTLERPKAPPTSVTEKEKNFADVLMNPEKIAAERKLGPDAPPPLPNNGRQPLPAGIGSVMAAGGPGGNPAFIPVPIATVPNVTRQPMAPPVFLPPGPPGGPNVSLPQPPNNPWSQNAFMPPAPGAGQQAPAFNAFMTPQPPPVAQPQMPGNAFDLQQQQQQQQQIQQAYGYPQQMPQQYYQQPGMMPQAGHYPPQAYYPQAMPAVGYPLQAAYQPQPGYPVAPVGYQMPQGQANGMANATMDRRTPQSESQAVSNLVRVLCESAYPAQREWAAQTLATYDHRNHPQVLQALCTTARQDPAATVRAGCVYSLSRLNIQGEPVLGTLQTLRTDTDPRVRQEVDEAYQRLGVKP
ncbi:MAG: hypothetical protein K2X38_14585 [Gemmataceae bacterium]|nr:hypothetical protein [Gemmataceae bacterium]